ncbi:MAG: hypothetical protein DRR08_19925 [Candidatus Parabeggiatoa sp. nov. 2]|nr:MAG: hypothetical protein DRR08_19925 [Gammaproteobacteria bacterium]
MEVAKIVDTLLNEVQDFISKNLNATNVENIFAKCVVKVVVLVAAQEAILMLNIFKTKFSSHLLNDCGNRVLKEGYIFKLISLSLANGPHHFSFFH